MDSSIEICNNALSLIGSRSIVSFVDNTVESRLCKVHYPISRRFILRKHPWNFAIKRVLLAETTDEPILRWSHSYERPADFIRLLEVIGTSDNIDLGSRITCDDYLFQENRITANDYLFEGNKILSNLTQIGIRYVSDIDDASKFDTEFRNVLAHHLAMEMCELLHGSTTKKRELKLIVDELLNDAKTTDSRENPAVQIQESSWLRARRY